MNFWQFTMYYLVVGVSLVIAHGIGEFIMIANRFGLDIACEAVKHCSDNYIVHYHTKIGEVFNILIGMILWPARLNECPEKSRLLWETCEELATTTETEKES